MQKPSRNGRLMVLTLGLMTGVPALTVDMSLPAIPDMVTALASTLPRGQLIVGIFMAGMAFGQIPAGLFADRLGRMPVLIAGTLLFSVAGIAAAASSDMDLLLMARFVQGFGAATPFVLARTIVRDIASGREAARLMSIMTMIFALAPIIAPVVGAFLVQAFGWRAPFVVLATFGIGLLALVKAALYETGEPKRDGHPLRQLYGSFRTFFSFQQSRYGLLFMIVPPVGYMSIIAVSAALMVDIYGMSLEAYGVLFALAGVSILAGSFLNRRLVEHFEVTTVIGIAALGCALAGVQLALIAWLDQAPIWWAWFGTCLFLLSVPLIMSNALVIALDPLPSIAGVASSIIGTLQNIFGATGAIVGALIYNGTLRHAVILVAGATLLTAVMVALRPWLVPGDLKHDPDVLRRD